MTVEYGALKPQGYLPRLTDERLSALLHTFGAVEVEGPKWCGKTWSALCWANSMTMLIDQGPRRAAELDPALALVGDEPHLVDEWQEVPEVWDAVRSAVDAGAGARGRFLLTGSHALKKQERERVRHSGAGRIGRLKMGTMTLAELGESDGSVGISALFRGETITPRQYDIGMETVARWCCRGGWPGARSFSDAEARELAMQYVRSVIETNVVDEGLSSATAERVLKALAFNVGQAATRTTLLKDMGIEAPSPSQANSLDEYLELFRRLFLVDEVGGWAPPLRAKNRVRVKPKRYFADPSLAAALLRATPQELIFDTQTLGLLFENLVMHDLSVFVETYRGDGGCLSYYRDDKGLEVDAIVERGNRWGAIEIKLSDLKVDEAAANLLRLRDKVCSNAAAASAEPAFLAVVTGRSTLLYRRPDGVYVIPAAALTA